LSIYGKRDLDVRVAEAMGWRWHSMDGPRGERRCLYSPEMPTLFPECSPDHGEPVAAIGVELPRYSTDPAAYMGLLERGCAAQGWELSKVGARDALFCCRIWNERGMAHFGSATTPGEAVCLAVLAALEGGAK